MKKKRRYIEAAIFISSLIIFAYIVFFAGRSWDINAHAHTVLQWANGVQKPPANFLYYLVVYTSAFFRPEINALLISSVFVLSLAVTAKFIITKNIFYDYIGDKVSKTKTHPDKFITLFCVSLIFAFSLPVFYAFTGTLYLCQIPPNVWHNSTVIFLMPFALLLFWLSYKQLVKPTPSRILAIALLCILNILIKPSYFLVFLIVYPLMLVFQFGRKKELWLNLLPVVLGIALLYIEYHLLFTLDHKSGITISPFVVWSYYSPNIPISILSAIFYPLVYLCFYYKEISKNMLLRYAVSGSLIAIFIAAMLSETGRRQFHGNFFWQATVCNYILFVVISILFVEKIQLSQKFGWRNKLIFLSFILHVVAGFVYLGKIFLFKNFF